MCFKRILVRKRGTVIITYLSGTVSFIAAFNQRLLDPDPDPDPAIFVSKLQDKKKSFLLVTF
jgi:hypothetical protein